MKITWTFDDDISNVIVRTWSFTSSDSSSKRTIALAIVNSRVVNFLPQFMVIPPATLVLNNVSQSYDGTYEFKLEVNGWRAYRSNVRVFIASKFQEERICLHMFMEMSIFSKLLGGFASNQNH